MLLLVTCAALLLRLATPILSTLSRLVLKLDLLEEVVRFLLPYGVMVRSDLIRLLCVTGRRDTRCEVPLGTCAIHVRLSQSQHILHLDVFEVLLDVGLGLVLVMARCEIRVE